MNPTTGSAGYCARAASGQRSDDAAALPSPAMNSRRRIRHASKPLCGQRIAVRVVWERVASRRGASFLPTFFCSAGGCLWPGAEVFVDARHFRLLGRTGRFLGQLDSPRMTQSGSRVCTAAAFFDGPCLTEASDRPYSVVMLAARITLADFSGSAAMSLSNLAGVMGSGTLPSSASCKERLNDSVQCGRIGPS